MSLMEKGELTYRQLMLQFQIIMNRARYGRLMDTKSKDELLNEAHVLAAEYVDDRLIRSGLNLKQRKISQPMKVVNAKQETLGSREENRLTMSMTLKSEKRANIEAVKIMAEKRHAPNGCLLTIDDILKVLLYVGETLEVKHPVVYTDVLQQLNVKTLADVNLRRIFMNVAKELFNDGISWPKIVSFFAFSGGTAVDCVLSGSSIHVTRVKNWIVEFIEAELVDWIAQQGGWVGLFDHFTTRHQPRIFSNYVWTISAFVLLLAVVLAAFMAYTLRIS